MTLLAKNVCLNCVKSLIKAAIRFCLANGIKLQEFTEVSKELFIKEAISELQAKSHKVNVSRISAMTGVHRKDVSAFKGSRSATPTHVDMITRIMGKWRTDKKVHYKRQKAPYLRLYGQRVRFFLLD